MNKRLTPLALLVTAVSLPLSLSAQKTYTAEDYKQAERWMSYSVTGLVKHSVGGVTYLPDGRVFYSDGGDNTTATAYMIADPAKGTQAPAFDNAALAAALSVGAKTKVDPAHLGVTSYKPEPEGRFAVTVRTGTYHCEAAATKCTLEAPPTPPVQRPEKADDGKTAATPSTNGKPVVKPVTIAPTTPAAAPARRRRPSLNESPDKKLGVFIRDSNLWLRVEATGEEKQLTTDGVKDFGYATDNAGWQHSDSAIATWSADSKKIATFQMDERKTGMMYLVPTTNRHPQLEAWHYPLVGDKDVSMVEPVVIDVATATVTRLKIAPEQHRSMECDDISCEGGKWTDAEFSPDDARLAFVSTSRDHKDETVRIASTTTGEVRDVFHEHADTYYGWQSNTDWKVLWAQNEFLWVSERSNWAQVYRYDLSTGKLKNEVTHGEGPVQDLKYIDEKKGLLYFVATGKQRGVDPYFEQLYSVGLDGRNQTLLTPEIAQHDVVAAPDGSSFVDVYSTATMPKVAVLRDPSGKVLLTLARQEITALVAAGWKAPVPITVKARDGKTELYGFMVKPMNFDPAKKYPVIDYVYPGPQDGSCGGPEARTFAPVRGDRQALAELGFVVVCIDGQGNPHRSKAFHDAHASRPEEMGDDTIPDQVSAIKDLATQFSYVDAAHVGIWGHSGGGNATVSAMFHFPEFFHVGWSESGNHDNRDYEDDWDERWAGLEVIGSDGKSNYDTQANQNYAKNLKGHLMIVHGTMDDNVPPTNSLLVVEALMKANKDFDMLMIPNVHHGYAEMSQYIAKRRWDYFVRYLAGGTPPADFQLKSYEEMVKMLYANGPSENIDDTDAVDDSAAAKN